LACSTSRMIEGVYTMAIGLYIHIPFCVKKCSYCDFISYPYDAGLAASYVCALDREMAQYAVEMSPEERRVRSIYVGGGTPTVLRGAQLVKIIEDCRKNFTVAGDAEITVECNPGTVDYNKLAEIRQAGVNRLSIGVQAQQQKLLDLLGRIHGWQQVAETVDNSRQAGFDNISLDLIFGIPGQSLRNWQRTLQNVLALFPEHISAYNLKIEPDTPLHRDVASGYLLPCDEELELKMFWHGIEYLTGNGFKHYEISNFARPGREARHNLIYWHNEEYLGLGPAAHSMFREKRFSNEENVELYIQKLLQGQPAVREAHQLSVAEQISETIFLALRLAEGLDLAGFEARFGKPVEGLFGAELRKLRGMGLVEITEKNLKLTKKGLPLANEVFAAFI